MHLTDNVHPNRWKPNLKWATWRSNLTLPTVWGPSLWTGWLRLEKNTSSRMRPSIWLLTTSIASYPQCLSFGESFSLLEPLPCYWLRMYHLFVSYKQIFFSFPTLYKYPPPLNVGNLRRYTLQRWQSLSTSQMTPTLRSKCWEWSIWCWKCSLLIWQHQLLTSFLHSTSASRLLANRWKTWQWWANGT